MIRQDSGFGRRFFRQFDVLLFFIVITAAIFGIVMIYSATHNYDNHMQFVVIQSAAFVLGLLLICVMTLIDYETLGDAYVILMAFNILALVLTLLLGQGEEEVGGKSWIRFGPIGLQPSELVKIGFIITFAKHLEMVEDDLNSARNLLMLTLHLGVLVGLILKQPDAGTAMMFMGIFIGMLFIAGLRTRFFVSAIAALMVLMPAAWFFVLKNYQKDRIMVFLKPETDPLGAGYQVLQSKVAIGSGQLSGVGYLKGILTQLGFLPAKHTDFIFAAISEELGFAGSAFVVVLLFALIGRCIYIAMTAKDKLGTYICVGVASMYFIQTLENVGMCIGLTPVTGVTLPFMSYGGSSLLTNMLAVGLVMNVSMRRKTLSF
ncbi:MAG: rod shape-determining protein RodA [Hyphomonadaceae bacterium]|nr:rod shape-determining protein RodA [Clostridia bacterium]